MLFKATQGLDGNKEHERISQGDLGNVGKEKKKKEKERGATLNVELPAVVAVNLPLKGQILLSESAESWGCADDSWLFHTPGEDVLQEPWLPGQWDCPKEP